MPACDASWSSASCTKCVGQGTIPASDGFVPCPQCGGAGKIQNRSPCCANHDESGGAHAGQDPHGHGHGHGHGSNDSSSTVFGALGPPGSTLPGFTGVVPSSLDELFDTLELVDHAGEKLDPAVHFKGKVIGVYFSSGSCPGCVRFSPTLNAFTEINARDYVTVLVPGDRDEASARAYANRYPAFASVPYNSIHRNLLLSAYKVMAIPQLCVYHYDDKAHVTGWGHSAVTYNPDTCVAEWHMGRQGYSWMDLTGVPKSWRCPAAMPGLKAPLLAGGT